MPKETFWHMVTHFFYDITHFDSSFFHTVRLLSLRPGFLSAEYMRGRRARYLHPIRMYVFSSALFFLLLFSVFKPVSVSNELDKPILPTERAAYVGKLQDSLKKDTANVDLLARLALALDSSHNLTVRDTTHFDDNDAVLSFVDVNYRSFEEFDSIEQTKPKSERQGWFMRKLIGKQIEINNKYRGRPDEALDKFLKSLLHRIPYLLFVSLPLFALILKLVYIRRKQFYYADHGVFTIHLYIFTFICLMVIMGLDRLDDLFNRDLFTWINAILFLGLFVYLYKAMRRFYGQGRGKTFVKFLIVSMLSIIMMVILFVAFAIFSGLTF